MTPIEIYTENKISFSQADAKRKKSNIRYKQLEINLMSDKKKSNIRYKQIEINFTKWE